MTERASERERGIGGGWLSWSAWLWAAAVGGARGYRWVAVNGDGGMSFGGV
jgi:hypothetical protein